MKKPLTEADARRELARLARGAQTDLDRVRDWAEREYAAMEARIQDLPPPKRVVH